MVFYTEQLKGLIMKKLLLLAALLNLSVPGYCQQYLGEFESGDSIPFLLIAAEPETGAPTDPIAPTYSVRRLGVPVMSGALARVELGVASGVIDTSGLPSGRYDILIAGQIAEVTAYAYKTFTLHPSGGSVGSIASEVAGLDGRTPLNADAYEAYHSAVIAEITGTQSRLGSLQAAQDALMTEIQIASRNLTRARLWFAENTIDSATRRVPADMPSHMEVQVAALDDVAFATPVATYYRIYSYPNALTASKPSREVYGVTPPVDGVFYRLPAVDW